MHLGLLQAQHVGLLVAQEAGHQLDAVAHRIDVPGGDFHVRIPSMLQLRNTICERNFIAM